MAASINVCAKVSPNSSAICEEHFLNFIPTFLLVFASTAVHGSEIHTAVEKNDLTKLKQLVEKDERWLAITFRDKQTALHLAAIKGNLEAAKILLKKPSQLKELDDSGNSPFHHALSACNEPLITFFLDNGGDLAFCNKQGRNGLHLVVATSQKTNIKLATLLLDKGMDVNAPSKDSFQTPLTLARSVEMIRLLLQRGANVNLKMEDRTALHAHVSFGNVDRVALLLDSKAEIDIVVGNSETPLHRAAGFRDLPMIQLLVERGAAVNFMDNSGRTPLDMALSVWPGISDEKKEQGSKCAEFLRSKGGKSGKQLPSSIKK